MRSSYRGSPAGQLRRSSRPWALTAVALVAAAVPVVPASARGTTWVWPLVPRPAVVRGFDAPNPDWQPGHRGVDLAGRVGEPVVAIGAGRVGFAGRIAGVDVVVVVHGALRSTYQPVLPLAAVGTEVAAGRRIGTLEVTGSHCLPAACLHLGLRRGNVYLDPLSLFGPRPVRLLPLDGSPLRPTGAAGHPPSMSAGTRDDLWVPSSGERRHHSTSPGALDHVRARSSGVGRALEAVSCPRLGPPSGPGVRHQPAGGPTVGGGLGAGMCLLIHLTQPLR